MPTIVVFFFFNDTATTEIYTLSLHDALPISRAQHHERSGEGLPGGARAPASPAARNGGHRRRACGELAPLANAAREDRKSTRLNSSHANISYAVFCLKKKKKHNE